MPARPLINPMGGIGLPLKRKRVNIIGSPNYGVYLLAGLLLAALIWAVSAVLPLNKQAGPFSGSAVKLEK